MKFFYFAFILSSFLLLSSSCKTVPVLPVYKSCVLWIGGGAGEIGDSVGDAERKARGDEVVAGNHATADIKGNWEEEGFWEAIRKKAPRIITIDPGSTSWFADKSLDKLKAFIKDFPSNYVMESDSEGRFFGANKPSLDSLFPQFYRYEVFYFGSPPQIVGFRIFPGKSPRKPSKQAVLDSREKAF